MTYDPAQFRSAGAALARLAPDASKAFTQQHSAAFADGALDRATKELMALAISIVTGCEDCCGHHMEAALTAGAGREQVAEAVSVALTMGGGPAYIYAGKVAAFLEGQP